MSRPDRADTPAELVCACPSCTEPATHRVHYHEEGTPTYRRMLCREHKDSACIHNPTGTTAVPLEEASR